MKRIISLNEGWQLGWTEFSGEAGPAATVQTACKYDATVPGDAHLDLVRCGVLPDLYFGRNLDHALWMEHKDWLYRCKFNTPDDLGHARAILVFHGLDTFATVWLNGQLLGKAANMFIRHEFDATPLLRGDGEPNELVVRLASTAHSVKIDPSHAPLNWSPQRLFCRKASMSFGWDIAPRLVTVGIWRPVELVLVDSARITGLWARPLRFDGSDALVRIEVDLEGFEDAPMQARVTGKLHDVAWSVDCALGRGANSVSVDVRIPEAPLWNPIGYGRPDMMELEASLEGAGGALDRRCCRTGLRRIELVMEPQPSGAESFRFRCNGKDVFVTGLNWTPLDSVFAAVTPQRITATLEALASIGCNMLRVWGGGIYEPPHFYAECSRLGILIWQDFMMACGWYPQTDQAAATFAHEGEQVVRDLRPFPCIAVWAGDNENDGMYPHLAASNRLTRQVLAEICRRLNGDIPYVPSSPWSPSGKTNPWEGSEGDSHFYNHGSGYRDPKNWNLCVRFLSEFGHLSLPSMEVIRKYFPPDQQWPITNETWRYHGADTTHTGFFRGPDCVLRSLAACGVPDPQDIEQAVAASQELQAQAVCAWIEHYSEDPEFWGFMLWNVGDCWPQHSDSVMDYLGNKKMVFARLGEVFSKVRKARGGS